MALKDWIKIDRAFRYRVEWIRKNNVNETVEIAKTNFADGNNYWYFKHNYHIEKINIKTKLKALKFAKAYMRKH